MPAVRITRRRRSSYSILYGKRRSSIVSVTTQPRNDADLHSTALPSRPITFTPNITPGTFVSLDDEINESACPTPTSFPSHPSSPSHTSAAAPHASESTKRAIPRRKKSLSYIPRPPNAFMLFRADFVKRKHTPGSIESNHASLSKIIGNCWHDLSLDEKRVWEIKAKHAKAEHKARYPNYQFKPIHNKKKKAKGERLTKLTPEDERRYESVVQLLLEGKQGDDLAAAVRDLERASSVEAFSQKTSTPSMDGLRSELPSVAGVHPGHSLGGLTIHTHRRSSSVPLPNAHEYFSPHGITLPTIPAISSLASTRPTSPVDISHSQRLRLGHRRASSAAPCFDSRLQDNALHSWNMDGMDFNPRSLAENINTDDVSMLLDVDMSLFNPNFLEVSSSLSSSLSFSDFGDLDFKFDAPAMVIPETHLGPLDVLPPPFASCQELLRAETDVHCYGRVGHDFGNANEGWDAIATSANPWDP